MIFADVAAFFAMPMPPCRFFAAIFAAPLADFFFSPSSFSPMPAAD
jgi:hypothetical protein